MRKALGQIEAELEGSRDVGTLTSDICCPEDEGAVDPGTVQAAISGLLLDAMLCLSPTRVADTVRNRLGRRDPASLPPDRQVALMADSLMMATTLAMFAPSAMADGWLH